MHALKTGTALEPCWNLPGTLLGTLLGTFLATLQAPCLNVAGTLLELSANLLDRRWKIVGTVLEPSWNLLGTCAGTLPEPSWNIVWCVLETSWNVPGLLLEPRWSHVGTFVFPLWLRSGASLWFRARRQVWEFYLFFCFVVCLVSMILPLLNVLGCYKHLGGAHLKMKILWTLMVCFTIPNSPKAILLGFNLSAEEQCQQDACSGKPKHLLEPPWNPVRNSAGSLEHCWNLAGTLLNLLEPGLESRSNLEPCYPAWKPRTLWKTLNLSPCETVGPYCPHCVL